MKKILLVWLLFFSFSANSQSEGVIEVCGKYKEVVLIVANSAENGVPKQQVKDQLPVSFGEMVDFVYYFTGVKTKQEIVANQLEQCLAQLQ